MSITVVRDAGSFVRARVVSAGETNRHDLELDIVHETAPPTSDLRHRPPPSRSRVFFLRSDEMWDTPYAFEKKEDFTCALGRGAKTNALFLVSHWLSKPFPTRWAICSA